jgi:hypothetical protein
MKVERIHLCLNDCILYQKDYTDMNRCSKCKASRYKLKDDQAENEIDDETDNKKKASSESVMVFIDNIEILATFSNERVTKLL